MTPWFRDDEWWSEDTPAPAIYRAVEFLRRLPVPNKSPPMILEQPERCNCIVWAWRMLRRYGGALVVRPSYYVRWLFHVAWTPRVGAPAEEILGYAPRRPISYGLDAPWFKGHVTTEAQEHREYTAFWTPEDRAILRQRAAKASDQMVDLKTGLRVYADYIATLNL